MKQKIQELITADKNDFKSLQSISEFSRWLELLVKIDAKIGMEIGIKRGGSTYWTLNCLPEIELYIGVDVKPTRQSEILEDKNDNLEMVYKDSATDECKEAVKSILNGRLLDFLFIDGNHKLAYTLSDWIMYHDLVRSGGLIGFHDINQLSGPRNAFRKIKELGRWSEEIVSVNTPENYQEDFAPNVLKLARRNDYNGFGIGVVSNK